MVVEIALAIVLAVLILAAIPLVLIAGWYALPWVAALGLLYFIIKEPALLPVIAFLVVGAVAFAALHRFFSRRRALSAALGLLIRLTFGAIVGALVAAGAVLGWDKDPWLSAALVAIVLVSYWLWYELSLRQRIRDYRRVRDQRTTGQQSPETLFPDQ